MTYEEWITEARRRFGDDASKWAFVCPSCGHVATVKDWRDAGAPEGEIAFSCVGRHLPGASDVGERSSPCNYAGGGLFRLNPTEVEGEHYFAFASEARSPREGAVDALQSPGRDGVVP
jgi:hypothetical protein